ncbi:MAG: hypothetical protein RLZZ76_177 [Candidatus Parcubacteria bacterium]|jgi:hypothetical protein
MQNIRAVQETTTNLWDVMATAKPGSMIIEPGTGKQYRVEVSDDNRRYPTPIPTQHSSIAA